MEQSGMHRRRAGSDDGNDSAKDECADAELHQRTHNSSLRSRAVAGPGLHQLLARADAREVAVVDDARAVTFAELDREVAEVSERLGAARAPGAAVAILAENSVDYITWLYAIPRAGMRALLLNVRDHPRSWAAILSRSECTLAVGDAHLLDRLAPECPPGVDVIDFANALVPGALTEGAEASEASASGHRALAAEHRRDKDDTAWIVPTSGTTGTPKLALLTHASLLAAARGCAEARPVAGDDVYLLAFPLCHVAAYNVLVQHLHGRTVVVTRRFEARRTAQLIERHRVTAASLAPTMIAALLDDIAHDDSRHDLSSLRLLAYGSAPIAEPLLRRAMADLGCDFSQGYGMTELSGNCAYLDADGHRRGLDDPDVLRSAGRPTSLVELRIVDDDGVAVATGEVGEIAVRGPQVMAGYLGDPDATAAAIVDGWLRTGDLGRLDAQGALTIVDRKKDVIVSGGENVASREVEAVLHADPTVAEAAVIGVPDERWGERVTAVIVPAPDAHVDEDALVARCRAALAAYKIPRRVVIVDTLPRNATGKVDKPELRRQMGRTTQAVEA
jgi:acyl-CoA synthetase (AMP-forming)/AMP-acid ligase II